MFTCGTQVSLGVMEGGGGGGGGGGKGHLQVDNMKWIF